MTTNINRMKKSELIELIGDLTDQIDELQKEVRRQSEVIARLNEASKRLSEPKTSPKSVAIAKEWHVLGKGRKSIASFDTMEEAARFAQENAPKKGISLTVFHAR